MLDLQLALDLLPVRPWAAGFRLVVYGTVLWRPLWRLCQVLLGQGLRLVERGLLGSFLVRGAVVAVQVAATELVG